MYLTFHSSPKISTHQNTEFFVLFFYPVKIVYYLQKNTNKFHICFGCPLFNFRDVNLFHNWCNINCKLAIIDGLFKYGQKGIQITIYIVDYFISSIPHIRVNWYTWHETLISWVDMFSLVLTLGYFDLCLRSKVMIKP